MSEGANCGNLIRPTVDVCAARSPGGAFKCALVRGHVGYHREVHSQTGHALAQWMDSDAVAFPIVTQRQGGSLQTPPTMAEFASGAKSTKVMPRLDLVPYRALELIARRFELGLVRHGERNYRKGSLRGPTPDPTFVTDRVNHLLRHAQLFAEHRDTANLSAILCNAAMLADLHADTVEVVPEEVS